MAVPQRELNILFARSGNRCAFAGCNRILTADNADSDRVVVLGEAAHIVAESLKGPRGNAPMSLEDRNRYTNLILLCSMHHKLIDDRPQTYTVDRLHVMKESHESEIQAAIGGVVDAALPVAPIPVKHDTVHSTLLPIDHMPQFIFGAPCSVARERDISYTELRPLRDREMAPFILRGGMLFVFQDLNDPSNPFVDVISGQPVERFRLREWLDDPDKERWLSDLLNRSLNKLTGRRGLQFDRQHRRYYFQAYEAGTELEVQYTPLNQSRATRKVVWQPQSRRTGERRGYWYHRAVSLRFFRANSTSWHLNLRPELRVTVDGVKPPPSESIGSKITRKKSRMFNYDLLSEVQFWRDYLSESRRRIILQFGSPGQYISISTTLLSGSVTWPGIPEEHAMPFSNVEYLDDLFTWAELEQLDVEDDEDEWLEVEGEDYEEVVHEIDQE